MLLQPLIDSYDWRFDSLIDDPPGADLLSKVGRYDPPAWTGNGWIPDEGFINNTVTGFTLAAIKFPYTQLPHAEFQEVVFSPAKRMARYGERAVMTVGEAVGAASEHVIRSAAQPAQAVMALFTAPIMASALKGMSQFVGMTAAFALISGCLTPANAATSIIDVVSAAGEAASGAAVAATQAVVEPMKAVGSLFLAPATTGLMQGMSAFVGMVATAALVSANTAGKSLLSLLRVLTMGLVRA